MIESRRPGRARAWTSRRRIALTAGAVALFASAAASGQGVSGAATAPEGVWEATAPLSVPRYDHTLSLLPSGDVVAVGGRITSTPRSVLASAEIYDTQEATWSPTGSLAQGRWRHTATLLRDGRLLVAGGFSGATGNNAQPVEDTVEIFDPATGTWSPAARMATRRALHSAVLLPSGKVLVVGGRTCDQPPPAVCDFTFRSSSAELYDPATNTWSSAGSMREARHTTAAVVLHDGTVLVPAGFTNKGNGDTADVYDPATGRWSETRKLNVPRARQGAMVLPDGTGLVVGGFQAMETSEVYDPATKRWSLSAGRIAIARFNFGYAVLPNGKALVAGGQSPTTPFGPSSSEVYDPATQQWSSAGTLTSPHVSTSSLSNSDQAVVLSSSPWEMASDPRGCGGSCGKVLVAGHSPTGAADLYTPSCPTVVPQHLRCVG
jgi:hypothetical protein